MSEAAIYHKKSSQILEFLFIPYWELTKITMIFKITNKSECANFVPKVYRSMHFNVFHSLLYLQLLIIEVDIGLQRLLEQLKALVQLAYYPQKVPEHLVVIDRLSYRQKLLWMLQILYIMNQSWRPRSCQLAHRKALSLLASMF